MRNKSIAKREAILQAAFAVVCGKGYYETRIDDVARAAGVAKGTVYLYFKDKPDLYVGIIQWLINQATTYLKEVASQPLPARGKLSAIFQLWTEKLLQHPAAIDLVFPEMRKEHCNIARRFQRQVLPEVKTLVNKVAEIIKDGVRAGEFRPVEPRLAALSFLNAFRAGLLLMSRELRIKAAPARALDLFLYGIVVKDKGGK
jgi:AcrR family transcriptional regulator